MLALAALWVGVSLSRGLSTDASLQRQLVQLQQQSQSLRQQIQAQHQELSSAASAAGQEELARSEGLAAAGDRVYVVENPVRAAGPATIQQAAAEVGQTARSLANSLLGLP